MSRRGVLVLAVLSGTVAPAAAQVRAGPPATGPRVVVRLGDSLPAPRVHPALRPGGRLGPPTAPQLVAEAWLADTRARLAATSRRRARARVLASLRLDLAAADTTPVRIPTPAELLAERDAEPEMTSALDLLAQYTDLGLDVQAHMEMKLDRLRNARCDAVDLNNPSSGCETGFPTPSFDQQFRVRAGGVVSDRLNVNVDFDSEREFDANNNINVWYEGRDGEILRRVEVGNVTLRAPPSRFITAAIPSNSFGVLAEAQLGPVALRSVFAQQKGSALRTRMFTVGESATQPVRLETRDVDFESGRFFFVVDPRTLPAYPDVDVLNLETALLPPAAQLQEVRVYRLQAQTGRAEDNLNLGGINAVAVRRDSPQRVGPFTWELLVEGRDYYLDPSRLWFALARRLSLQEFLAVSFVTSVGDTVGTFPTVNTGLDTLELIFEPRRGTDVPTFFYEMRNVYRLGGGDVTRNSIELAIVVNESEQPLGGGGTYLSRLGLARITDPNTIDEFNRVFPRPRDPNAGEPIRDLFVVFPHLVPFADSTRLLASERNDSLYRTPTYLLASEAPTPRFLLRFGYQATGAGDPSTLSLGALQVREGSEAIFVNGRRLVRGRDYEVDYSLGQLRFLRPDSLFLGPTEVQAQFEENQLLDIASKSIFGVTGTYALGAEGNLHAIALFQRDRSAFTRPLLGFEPESHFIAGLGTELEFQPDGLTRLVDALPLITTDVPSRLTINGEIAMSQPNANQAGVAYIEDFQSEAARAIALTERSFQLGSAPQDGRGLPATHLGIGGGFESTDAVPLVWQNAVQLGGETVEFGSRDIDTTIALFGAGFQVEPVLWLSLKPDTVGGAPHPIGGRPRWLRSHTPGPRWRSITQPLGGGSGVGLDVSRMEFLEFWVLEDADRTARQQSVAVMFDFGQVFEDATALAPRTFTPVANDTVFSGVTTVGDGRLDSERDSLTNVFNATVDDIGIHGDRLESIVNATTGAIVTDLPLCDLQGVFGVPVFPLGSLEATCTRENGRLDTEDLNGDNRLDRSVGIGQENVLRYVFQFDDRYFVREGQARLDERGRPMRWRLYRMPFRSDTIQIGRPNVRQVQALRMTVVAPPAGPAEPEIFFAFARLRLVGAPWLKRAPTPIRGLSGAEGELRGEVVASVVSTENRDLGYTPPPGITNQADRRGTGFELGLQEINEKSLRLLARDLRAGERAEAFIRFADEADRNFLTYRQLRVWARGRGAGWVERDLEFYVKVGRDEHNFYLFRTALNTDTWEPEVVVDLQQWLALRADIEADWLRGEPPSGAATCGGDSTAYVRCSGGYVVHVRDPGVAPPNLARVSEVAVGLFRPQVTAAIPEAELWVNDIRLTGLVNDLGVAASLDARLTAADVAEFSVVLSTRDDQFRQLGQDPSYVTDASTRVGTLLRLDKLVPEAWGLHMPLNVQYERSTAAPFFVRRSDVLAEALPNLRNPRTTATTFDWSLRRVKQGGTLAERVLVDPLTLRVHHANVTEVASFHRARTEDRQFGLGYSHRPGPRTVAIVPGFLVDLVNALPDWLRESEFGKAVRSARLRVNPLQVRFNSTLTDFATRRMTFRVPVELATDSALPPLGSIVHTWRNESGVDLRPFQTLTFRVTHVSVRDLQDYGDSSTVGRLLGEARRGLLGRDIGFERERQLATVLTINPVVSSWLRPRVSVVTNFALRRDPNARTVVRTGNDSTGAFRIPETLANSRRREVGATLDARRLGEGLGAGGVVGAILRSLLPADLSHALERRSVFDRAPFAPSLGFHLAMGDVEEFRERAGVPATSAAELWDVVASGGTRLPLGALIRLSYRHGENIVWLRRAALQSEIRQQHREWPSVTVAWAYAPQWRLRDAVTALNAQVRYVESERVSLQPAFQGGTGRDGAVRTENNSRLLAPSLSVSWVGGITTTAQLSHGTTDLITAGNLTQSERRDWGASVNFGFRLPRELFPTRERIQTTVAFTSSTVATCLLRADADTCRTIADSRRNQFDVRLDTGFSEVVRGGATFSYVLSDQRHTSNKFTQTVFTIFADINLVAGQSP